MAGKGWLQDTPGGGWEFGYVAFDDAIEGGSELNRTLPYILLPLNSTIMYLDRYDLNAGENLTTFYFVSEGSRGRFIKVIQFEPMELEEVYNLACGDHDAATGQINDKAVTDNGDTEKVLATVVAALYKFADHYPAAWVYATGSTAARTRLYRIGINRY